MFHLFPSFPSQTKCSFLTHAPPPCRSMLCLNSCFPPSKHPPQLTLINQSVQQTKQLFYSGSISMQTSPSPSPLIQIYIRLYNGNGRPIDLSPSDTINTLIQQINQLDLQLPHTYRLLFKGRYIRHYHLSLGQMGMRQNCIVHVEEVSQVSSSERVANMDVCVNLQEETFIVKLVTNYTIKQLKQSIHKLIQVQPRHQLLIFNGRKLQNHNSLLHYSIRPNSLINLISTAKRTDGQHEPEDYGSIIHRLNQKQSSLLESAISVGERSQVSAKVALFRSDSIDKKNIQNLAPIQVEIQQKDNDQNMSVSDGKEFNFELFTGFKMNPMTLSVDHGPFDALICNIQGRNKSPTRKVTLFEDSESDLSEWGE